MAKVTQILFGRASLESEAPTDIGDRHVDTGPVGVRWDELKGRIDTYTLPCVKWIASGKLVHSAGTSAGAL